MATILKNLETFYHDGVKILVETRIPQDRLRKTLFVSFSCRKRTYSRSFSTPLDRIWVREIASYKAKDWLKEMIYVIEQERATRI